MKEKTFYLIKIFIVSIAVFLLCQSQILYPIDKMVSDRLYQTATPTDSRIKIIAIDERTIQEYGDINNWNRDIYANLVEVLNQQEDTKPAVIAFDIIYTSEGQKEADLRFAEACKASGNVITAVNAVTKDKLILQQDNTLYLNEMYVDHVEYPYDDLKQNTTYGFANTTQDKDGYIRCALWDLNHNGETIDSLAVHIYKTYCNITGQEMKQPKLFAGNIFGFTFSGKSGAYEVISLCDVLNHKINAQVFADTIVLVGAYAPGMQDSYNVAIQKGAQMYGVEIHANIVEALLEEKTNVPMSEYFYFGIIILIGVVFYIISGKIKIIPATILMIGILVLNIVGGKVLYQNGISMGIIRIVAGIIFILPDMI